MRPAKGLLMDTPTPDPTPVPPQPPTPAVPANPPAPAPEPSSTKPPSGGLSEQQWIVFLNLAAFGGVIIPSLGHILGPLIIWLIKKSDSPAIDAAGRNVLNFQISWTIWFVVSVIIAFVGSCIVIPLGLPVAVGIAWIVFVILGAMKASNGETYKFPLTIKML